MGCPGGTGREPPLDAAIGPDGGTAGVAPDGVAGVGPVIPGFTAVTSVFAGDGTAVPAGDPDAPVPLVGDTLPEEEAPPVVRGSPPTGGTAGDGPEGSDRPASGFRFSRVASTSSLDDPVRSGVAGLASGPTIGSARFCHQGGPEATERSPAPLLPSPGAAGGGPTEAGVFALARVSMLADGVGLPGAAALPVTGGRGAAPGCPARGDDPAREPPAGVLGAGLATGVRPAGAAGFFWSASGGILGCGVDEPADTSMSGCSPSFP